MWLFKSPDELPHSSPLTSWQVTQRQSLPRTAFQLTYPWECSVLQPALHSQCRECPAELTWAVRCELTPVFPCTCFYWIKLMCEAGWLSSLVFAVEGGGLQMKHRQTRTPARRRLSPFYANMSGCCWVSEQRKAPLGCYLWSVSCECIYF